MRQFVPVCTTCSVDVEPTAIIHGGLGKRGSGLSTFQSLAIIAAHLPRAAHVLAAIGNA